MGNNVDIAVELASLQEAVGKMNTQAVEKITSLVADWNSYYTQLKYDEWTEEEACLAFAQSYRSAIGAYDQVMQGMKADITKYRDELQATHDAYRDRDDSVMQEMNTRLGKLDDASEAARMGGIALNQRTNLGYEGQGKPIAPSDTSPDIPDEPGTGRQR